ncbi:response regulator [Microbulbifer hydrolyticus]|uniref:Response regulator n=1 Tax=Microbulbifer hydrolyticus TaxID=48074 RepID=A0A6P1TBX8_9GAMM|nr:response regulator [Microbulbifer hydrolyticus]MBB5211019.1 two-component system OmpR family response regulator [Microbulbifer hydrolyticus]QHQ38172.1 response regulator [Microbulbifer hydrolyticus]
MEHFELSKARILIVDDGDEARAVLAGLLESEGYGVETARDGEQMLACLGASTVDLILLEVNLPGTDGFELCRYLCGDDALPPVVFVTDRGDEVDRVVGLEMGADDYVVKPYCQRELLARVKAVLRRANRPPRTGKRGLYAFSGWRFCPTQMELLDPQSKIIPLSSSETELLQAFVQHPQEPLSRDRLLDLTKGRESFPFDRSIDSHVSRLRRKLGDDAKHPEIIKTAWGTGYIFTYEVAVE